MTNEVRLVLVPLLAIVFGLIFYFRTVDGKTAEVFRCLFFCGLFIAIWILTFGGFPLR